MGLTDKGRRFFINVALVLGAVGVFFGVKFAMKKGIVKAPATANIVSEIDGKDALNVCVNTWGGYAGAQWFNGGFKASKTSKYWAEYQLPVNFIKIDDATSIDAFKADKCQIHYGTVDAFTTMVGALADDAPQIFFQADWSRGGDVLIGTASIKAVKDLRGKRVALWKGTPSHTLLLKSLEAAGMKESDVVVVSTKDAFDAKKVFQAGEAEAAAVWSPDDQDLIGSVPGAHVLASTKQATNIIADIFFAKKAFIEAHPDQIKAFTEGFMKGSAALNTNPTAKAEAVAILTAGLEMPEDFIKIAIDNARLSTYGDNVNFFNLKGGYTGVTGKFIYEDMGRKFRAVGMVEGELPNWNAVVNTSVLRTITLSGPEHAGEGNFQFQAADAETQHAEAFSTKSVTVEYASGSSKLSEDAMIALDTAVVNTIKAFAGARIRISGNTDDVGSDETNVPLSLRRAESVRDYLANKFGYDRDRFIVEGNGSRNPVAQGATAAARAKNRRTDVAVITAK